MDLAMLARQIAWNREPIELASSRKSLRRTAVHGGARLGSGRRAGSDALASIPEGRDGGGSCTWLWRRVEAS